MQQEDHQQHQKMGFSGPAGPATGGGAGGGVLARFLSAPASWLDALLLEMDEPQPQQQQTPPPSAAAPRPPAAPKPKSESVPERPPPLGRSNSISDPTSFLDSAFSRHNSCPPEFLARLASEELFSASDFNASSIPEAPSHKRTRQSELSENPSSQSSAPVSDMELDSLFQDSVPCRVRAKRGCATHPRSIAERVRRTRISDRIRKLQEVVPNMDKQTNTADMLEEAVEYVKTLQKQVQDLIEHQKKCKCLGSE